MSENGNRLSQIQGIPVLNKEVLSIELWTSLIGVGNIYVSDDMGKNPKLTEALRGLATLAKAGGFAVSNETFYVEYQRGLFRWKDGDSAWTDTGLIDLGEQSKRDSENASKLAASGETVYVGKRDGRLFQSLDEGDSWRDITPNLPLRFTHFKEIVFVGSTVYVATDKGVLSSQTGAYWRVLTDRMGARIVINRLTVDHTRVYGASDTGVYHLGDNGKWEQVLPSVPGKVNALAVHNDKLYIDANYRGMFYISLEKLQ